ncbi:esterase/lipase family protein [Nocardioides sp. CPCC 206347]|uniref:esterase/lipase family protein n=1 Tax=Nocardioides sp. CPCC 206347 TaxID=3406463 RepID=UPI003B43C35A
MTLRKTLAGLLAAGMLTATPVLAVTAPAEAATADPVVIVPGLFGNGPGAAQVGYAYLQARLVSAGFDVEVFAAPDYGTGDIHANAARLGDFIDDVLAETGAAKVDLVAHSQGGVMARDYVKTLGGDAKVDSLVMYGTPNYGTQVASLATQWGGGSCFAIVGCAQQAIGSSYLTALNAGDDTIGAVRYTAIATEYDSVTTPYENAFLNAGDGNITNVTVQSQCAAWRWADHFSITYDAVVVDGVVDALKGGPVQMNCFAF